MANFVVIVDPDPERRSHYIKAIEPLLPPVKGLITNSCSVGHFQAIWAANPKAPISYIAEPSGAAVIWGDAIAQDSSARIEASTLRHLWKPSDHQSYFDGFYAAVVYDSQGSLCVGADLLGLFPVYYYTIRDVVLIGSSPELFRYHPLFKAAFNPAGLVGILLTNGIINGQTLWQDVKRLGAGNLLVWQPDSLPKEVKQYQIESYSNQEYNHLSFAEQIDILEQVISQAIARHTSADESYSFLLSGGLDSRMIGGFLNKQGINPVALTAGRHSDIGMKCAIPVAKNLGFQHQAVPIPFEKYLSYADLIVTWEHLGNGCNSIMGLGWGLYDQLAHLVSRVISGFLLDRVIGGKSAYSLSPDQLSFETFFAQGINLCGFSPQVLNRLLVKEVFGELVLETLVQIQTTYKSYSEIEFKRAWWFDLYHRQRFLIGSIAGWQLCFGAWPIIPCLDRKFFKTAAGLSVQTIAQRRAQKNLVSTRFEQLAKLPLEGQNFVTEPLQTNSALIPLFKLQQKWRKLQHKLGYERRYYQRTFDINNPGWQAVRLQAEPFRKQMKDFFYEDVFNELLPNPDVPMQFKNDPIAASSSVKVLLGFLLWSKDHL
jgi:asparagine synthase (glutamine-hydrolysing)